MALGLGVGGRRGCQGVAEVGPPRQTVVLCGMGLGRGRRLVARNAGGRDMELGRGVAEGGGLQKEGSQPKRNCSVPFHRICHLSFWLKGVIKVWIRTAALAARQPLRQLQLAVIREGCRFRKRSNHRSLGGERGQHWQDKVQLSGYFDTGFKPALCGSSGAWLGNSS